MTISQEGENGVNNVGARISNETCGEGQLLHCSVDQRKFLMSNSLLLQGLNNHDATIAYSMKVPPLFQSNDHQEGCHSVLTLFSQKIVFWKGSRNHTCLSSMAKFFCPQVPYMIQYAEFLASEGYPGTDSEDVLLCAADILHDLEEEEEEEDNELETGRQSRGGGGSVASGSKHSRQRR